MMDKADIVKNVITGVIIVGIVGSINVSFSAMESGKAIARFQEKVEKLEDDTKDLHKEAKELEEEAEKLISNI